MLLSWIFADFKMLDEGEITAAAVHRSDREGGNQGPLQLRRREADVTRQPIPAFRSS